MFYQHYFTALVGMDLVLETISLKNNIYIYRYIVLQLSLNFINVVRSWKAFIWDGNAKQYG